MAEGVNGVATLVRSRNHKCRALRGKTNFYQSTCMEYRYGDGKVIGTPPHPTCGLACIHCVPCLNLIKGIFNTLF